MPPQSLEEQWDVPGLEKALAADLKLQLPIQEWLQQEPDLDEEQLRSRIVAAAHETYEAKIALGRPCGHAPVRAGDDAAEPRYALARASVGARPSAAGHPSAGLRAEESQAGVQARGLRAVLGNVRAGQDRGHADPHERAGAHRRGGRSRSRSSRPSCRTSTTSTPTTTRRSPRRTPIRRRSRSCAPARRSAATTRARAGRGRSTSSATAN